MKNSERDKGLSIAIEKAGGVRALARLLGMSSAALAEWKRIPADRILQIETATKIAREKLRPDLYRGH